MGSRCAAPAVHLQPLLYMCSLCCTSAAPAVHVQPQPSIASHSQPCTATARQLPNLTKTVQNCRFFIFWLDTCNPCCTSAALAVHLQPLLYICSPCYTCLQPLLHMPAAPAVHLQPLLYICSPCCTSAAPAVHVQPLLYICSPCCTCAASAVLLQPLLYMCSHSQAEPAIASHAQPQPGSSKILRKRCKKVGFSHFG